MELETTPPQQDEVTRAIREVVAEEQSTPDPWWREGLEEALRE